MLPTLPWELIEKIAYASDINARVALKVKPKKLDPDLILKMNIFLRRKFESRYLSYRDIISSLYNTSKNKYMYVGYNYTLDVMNFVFITGTPHFGLENFIFFNNLERGVSYYIPDIFNPAVDLAITKSFALGINLTPFNWCLIA
jgi:hypothetical protein